MRLNIDYEELKNALDTYDGGIERGRILQNKANEIFFEKDEIAAKFFWNFIPYLKKSESQDTQVYKIHESLEIINNSSYIDNMSIKKSKYLEDGEKVQVTYKDCKRFGRFYRDLLNSVQTYDQNQDGSYDSGSIKAELKKNLESGDTKAATKSYQSLIAIFGLKKAKKIANELIKETGAKVTLSSKVINIKTSKSNKNVKTEKKVYTIREPKIKKKKDNDLVELKLDNKDKKSKKTGAKKINNSKFKIIGSKEYVVLNPKIKKHTGAKKTITSKFKIIGSDSEYVELK